MKLVFGMLRDVSKVFLSSVEVDAFAFTTALTSKVTRFGMAIADLS